MVWFALRLLIFVTISRADNPWYYSCDDEDPLCSKYVSRGDCLGATDSGELDADLMISTNSRCKKSCLEYLRDNFRSLSPIMQLQVREAGGLSEEYFEDYLGFKHSICDLRKGFGHEARENLIWSSYVAFLMKQEETSLVKRYTSEGIKKSKVPPDLLGEILRHYQDLNSSNFEQENCLKGLHNCSIISENEDNCHETSIDTMQKSKIPEDLKTKIGRYLLDLAQDWSGLPLELSTVYGIRRYLNGAWMGTHVDKANSHIISAIINVGQRVNKPWPLDIMNHNYEVKHIVFKPGDLLWYESATLPHGRVSPLNGDFYDNIFVHFRPIKL